MSFYRMRHWWDSFSRMPSNIWWVGATCDIIPLLQVSHRFRHISGNIKWTPVQWNWCLCLHRNDTFNGWRSNLYSLTIVILLSWLLFSFRGRGEGFNARASAWASFNLKAEVFFSSLVNSILSSLCCNRTLEVIYHKNDEHQCQSLLTIWEQANHIVIFVCL